MTRHASHSKNRAKPFVAQKPGFAYNDNKTHHAARQEPAGGPQKEQATLMKTKEDIVKDWLPRYTGMPLEKFEKHVLICNFSKYVRAFAKHNNAEIFGEDREMQACSADGITILKFGMGSSQAATCIDLLTAVAPRAVLFLGKCGALKSMAVGDYLLPLAGIRGEGTSDDYLPPEVPALPSFSIQKSISKVVSDQFRREYFTGTVYTTNRRVWEYDEKFKTYLREIRATAIDMETATLFTCAFANHMPIGALLLASDTPMTPEGVKTAESDKKVDKAHLTEHLKIGVATLKDLIFRGEAVKHLHF